MAFLVSTKNASNVILNLNVLYRILNNSNNFLFRMQIFLMYKIEHIISFLNNEKHFGYICLFQNEEIWKIVMLLHQMQKVWNFFFIHREIIEISSFKIHTNIICFFLFWRKIIKMNIVLKKDLLEFGCDVVNLSDVVWKYCNSILA